MIFLILTIIQSSLSPEVMEISYLHSSSVLLLQAIFSYKCLEFKKKKKQPQIFLQVCLFSLA